MKITMDNNTIGLIVRGKQSADHEPGVMEQHADCILSTGEPVGYFGGGGAASSGSTSGSWGSVGLNLKGYVSRYERMKQERPFYVNLRDAKQLKVVSTVLLIKTDKDKATLFDKFWINLEADPGAFYLLGKNCSSRASKAFVAANIVSEGIPGLDTPDNLYRQLTRRLEKHVTSYSGYIGFYKSRMSGRFELEIEPVKTK